jgi:hypothetical protein
MTDESRSLTQVAADLKADAAKLSGTLYMHGSPDSDLAAVHDFAERMDTTADILASSGMGDVRARGGATTTPRDLIGLAGKMSSDVAKLTVGLHDAGLDPLAVERLRSDAHGFAELGMTMAALLPELGAKEPVHFTAATPNLKRLEGKLPGERPTTLDQAARKLESRLRHDRLNRQPEESLHPVERVGMHMAQKAYGHLGTGEGARVGGNDIAELNRMAAAKRESRRPHSPKPYTPPETYTQPERKIYRSKA